MPEQPTLFKPPAPHGGRPLHYDPSCWEKCRWCENYWCAIHEMHVHDCDCPAIEEWTGNPYEMRISQRATELRDEGIAKADAAAKEDWKASAIAAVYVAAQTHDRFTTTAVWALLAKDASITPTREPRAMGAIMRKAQKNGWIEPTDKFLNTNRASRHRAPVRIWRSLLYKED